MSALHPHPAMSDDPAARVRQHIEQLQSRGDLPRLLAGIHGGANDVIDAEEFQQEALARALRYADAFRGQSEAEFLAWLRTLSERLFIDRIRKVRRDPRFTPLDSSASEIEDQDTGVDVDLRGWLEYALEGLTPLEVAFLESRYEAGLSFPQIARILQVTPEAARQMHHRLLKRIRSRVEPPD